MTLTLLHWLFPWFWLIWFCTTVTSTDGSWFSTTVTSTDGSWFPTLLLLVMVLAQVVFMFLAVGWFPWSMSIVMKLNLWEERSAKKSKAAKFFSLVLFTNHLVLLGKTRLHGIPKRHDWIRYWSYCMTLCRQDVCLFPLCDPSYMGSKGNNLLCADIFSVLIIRTIFCAMYSKINTTSRSHNSWKKMILPVEPVCQCLIDTLLLFGRA